MFPGVQMITPDCVARVLVLELGQILFIFEFGGYFEAALLSCY